VFSQDSKTLGFCPSKNFPRGFPTKILHACTFAHSGYMSDKSQRPRFPYPTVEDITAGMAVTFAPRHFPNFCGSLCLSIQQLRPFNEVLYGTWFQEMMAQVPKS
jgi:hypothetical protein